MNEINGIINLLKPTGMTSSDGVAKIRGVLKEKRVGHMGTLDPLASGVLPIAVGKATRLFDVFLKKDKKYRGFFDFSAITDTLDSDGVVLNRSDRIVTKEEIIAVLPKFIGLIQQVPPMYSAKCVNGQRAYQLARQNVEVELKPSNVTIFDMKIIDQYSETGYVFDIHCSSGTYIRSIVRDIATELGVCGFMAGLIRLSSGPYTIENSITFEELEITRRDSLISPEEALSFLPEIRLTSEKSIRELSNGIKQESKLPDGDYRLYFSEQFCGLATITKGIVKIIVNFLT